MYDYYEAWYPHCVDDQGVRGHFYSDGLKGECPRKKITGHNCDNAICRFIEVKKPGLICPLHKAPGRTPNNEVRRRTFEEYKEEGIQLLNQHMEQLRQQQQQQQDFEIIHDTTHLCPDTDEDADSRRYINQSQYQDLDGLYFPELEEEETPFPDLRRGHTPEPELWQAPRERRKPQWGNSSLRAQALPQGIRRRGQTQGLQGKLEQDLARHSTKKHLAVSTIQTLLTQE